MDPRPDARALRRYLEAGGVIAYATESCFGLGCDPRSHRAVSRILRLKGRPRSKGLILVAADFAQLAPYLAPLPGELAGRLGQWWPGPNTLLLQAARNCPKWLTGRHGKLAVRVTAHPQAARLCAGPDWPGDGGGLVLHPGLRLMDQVTARMPVLRSRTWAGSRGLRSRCLG